MKIAYIQKYDPAHPEDSILRISEFSAAEAGEFKNMFGELADGQIDEIDINKFQFIYSIAGINLILKLGQEDQGIYQTAQNQFTCILSSNGWQNAKELTQPFSEKDIIEGYQWLYDLDTEIEFLLSANGKW